MTRGWLVAALLVAGAPAAAQDFSGIVERVDGAVGRVLLPGSSGSGFVIARDGDDMLFVTNDHVVDAGDDILVGFGRGDEVALYEASVEHSSPPLDLAVLRLRHLSGPRHRPDALALASGPLRKAQPVAAIGFPAAADDLTEGAGHPAYFESTFSTGAVGKVFEGDWDAGGAPFEIVQHTAPISAGSSGGPLIDICGRVAGVNSARLVDGDGEARVADGMFRASSAGAVRGFLDAQGVAYAAAPCRAEAAAPAAVSAAGERTAARPPGWRPFWVLAIGAMAVGGLLAAAGYVVHARSATVPEPEPATAAAPAPGAEVGLDLLVSGRQGTVSRHGVTTAQLRSGVTIGRAASADVRLDNRELSRKHVRLKLLDRRLTVTDLGSSNGTLLDGRRLPANQCVQINSASTIGIGDLSLRVRHPAAGPEQAGGGQPS